MTTKWTCHACTLENSNPTGLACEVCQTERRNFSSPSAGQLGAPANDERERGVVGGKGSSGPSLKRQKVQVKAEIKRDELDDVETDDEKEVSHESEAVKQETDDEGEAGDNKDAKLKEETDDEEEAKDNSAMKQETDDEVDGSSGDVGPEAEDDSDESFNKESFLTKRLFLLNSFISRRLKENRCFGPFIRAGLATPGFEKVTKEVADMIPNSTYEELRNAIYRDLRKSGALNDEKDNSRDMSQARQVALWLNGAVVGTFVIMRHEYPTCPYLPSRLKDKSGNFIGKVYVIGVVTKTIKPGSEEEDEVARNRLSELHYDLATWSLCEVSWKWMGKKDALLLDTQKYINSVCQPTLAEMCKPGGTIDSESMRRDLWNKATIPISSDDFHDVFKERQQ